MLLSQASSLFVFKRSTFALFSFFENISKETFEELDFNEVKYLDDFE